MRKSIVVLSLVALLFSNLSLINSLNSVKRSFYTVKRAFETLQESYPKGYWMSEEDHMTSLKEQEKFFTYIIDSQNQYIKKLEGYGKDSRSH